MIRSSSNSSLCYHMQQRSRVKLLSHINCLLTVEFHLENNLTDFYHFLKICLVYPHNNKLPSEPPKSLLYSFNNLPVFYTNMLRHKLIFILTLSWTGFYAGPPLQELHQFLSWKRHFFFYCCQRQWKCIENINRFSVFLPFCVFMTICDSNYRNSLLVCSFIFVLYIALSDK